MIGRSRASQKAPMLEIEPCLIQFSFFQLIQARLVRLSHDHIVRNQMYVKELCIAENCLFTIHQTCNLLLKPSRNKTGPTFVGLLIFLISFFGSRHRIKILRKRIQKVSLPTNFRPFLFREGFTKVE